MWSCGDLKQISLRECMRVSRSIDGALKSSGRYSQIRWRADGDRMNRIHLLRRSTRSSEADREPHLSHPSYLSHPS
jgi:hypothetical protein